MIQDDGVSYSRVSKLTYMWSRVLDDRDQMIADHDRDRFLAIGDLIAIILKKDDRMI